MEVKSTKNKSESFAGFVGLRNVQVLLVNHESVNYISEIVINHFLQFIPEKFLHHVC